MVIAVRLTVDAGLLAIGNSLADDRTSFHFAVPGVALRSNLGQTRRRSLAGNHDMTLEHHRRFSRTFVPNYAASAAAAEGSFDNHAPTFPLAL